MYDAYDSNKFVVKIIDFDKYQPNSDEKADFNVIKGLQYVIWYLNNIIARVDHHLKEIQEEKLKIFDSFEVVPEQKLN